MVTSATCIAKFDLNLNLYFSTNVLLYFLARMETEELSRLKVVLGGYDIYNPFEAGRVERLVSQVAIHPGFNLHDMASRI